MKRAALYMRVSTKGHGQTTETQAVALHEYAAHRGFEIVLEYRDDSGCCSNFFAASAIALTALGRDWPYRFAMRIVVAALQPISSAPTGKSILCSSMRVQPEIRR